MAFYFWSLMSFILLLSSIRSCLAMPLFIALHSYRGYSRAAPLRHPASLVCRCPDSPGHCLGSAFPVSSLLDVGPVLVLMKPAPFM